MRNFVVLTDERPGMCFCFIFFKEWSELTNGPKRWEEDTFQQKSKVRKLEKKSDIRISDQNFEITI